MPSRFAFFLLGAAAASLIWLIVLAFLNAELFQTFLNFSGRS
jgi:arginine exporter protein ArgO